MLSAPPDVKIGLYRVAQEALNNVAKHSAATSALLRLVCSDDGVELVVEDDGRGFDVAQVGPDSLGLNIMRERTEAIGAQLEVRTEAGNGTRVMVSWTPVLAPATGGSADAAE